MEEFKFEKRRSRVKNCPCGKSNNDGKFVPYVGHEDKGYCHSCCEVFLPEIEIEGDEKKDRKKSFFPPPPKQVSLIEKKHLDDSLKAYDQNNFVQFLINKFGKSKAMQAVEAYKIGTSKRWAGSNIFWQIDHEDKVRSGKIMVYDTSTGKRHKDKNSWAHVALRLENFNLNQCLFGSHLIKSDHTKAVAIAESEKTAIIASIVKPEFIWLATGGKNGLKSDKCQILSNRNVFLFPDLTKPGDKINCFEYWSNKAKDITKDIPGLIIKISDYLEVNATEEEKIQGLDISDYFLKWEWVNEGNEQNEPSEKQYISEDEQAREIDHVSKQIIEVIQDIRREETKQSNFRNEIRNNFIPEETIRANKELLRKFRFSFYKAQFP